MNGAVRGRLEKFVLTFPPGSNERRYYEFTAKLLAELSLDETNEAAGFAAMKMLYWGRIVSKDGSRLGHDSTMMLGSVEDVARLVAAVFGGVNPDPIWWKAHFMTRCNSPAVEPLVASIEGEVRALPWILNAHLPR